MIEDIYAAIQHIAITIAKTIRNPDLGYSNSANPSGEEQLKLDILSDQIIQKALSGIDVIKELISEEKPEPLPLHDAGRYLVCYDPLDGSSLVDVNLSVGSIFGIYDGRLQGSALVGAAYVVYGPRIEIVQVLKGQKPHLLREENGVFKYIGEIELASKGKLVAPGGTQKGWSHQHKQAIDALFAQGYRLRYSGGMVPDLHQILLKRGGLFAYPATSDVPKGKLRQLFEVMPFALIYEAAGGKAYNDQGKRLLELAPDHIHDTTSCFFGSSKEIDFLMECYHG